MSHAEVHYQVGKRRAQHELDDSLDDLGNGGREHIALSLEIAAVDRRDAAEKNRGRKGKHRVNRIRRLYKFEGVRKADKHKSDGADESDHQKQRDRYPVNLLDVLVPLLSHILGNHSRDNDRQTACGDGEDNAEYLVGVVVNAHSH